MSWTCLFEVDGKLRPTPLPVSKRSEYGCLKSTTKTSAAIYQGSKRSSHHFFKIGRASENARGGTTLKQAIALIKVRDDSTRQLPTPWLMLRVDVRV